MPICGFLGNVWEGVPKAAKGNRKLRSGLKSCRHRAEGAAEGQQHSCRYRRCLPTGAWLRLQLSSHMPTLTGAAGVKPLSGNPLTQPAILGSMCPGHQPCGSAATISLPLIPARHLFCLDIWIPGHVPCPLHFRVLSSPDWYSSRGRLSAQLCSQTTWVDPVG